jgi:hypothetical protein
MGDAIEVDVASWDEGESRPVRAASVDSHPGLEGAELVGWRRKKAGNLGSSCIEAELGNPFPELRSSVLALPKKWRVGLLTFEGDDAEVNIELGDNLPSLMVLDLWLAPSPTIPLALSIKKLKAREEEDIEAAIEWLSVCWLLAVLAKSNWEEKDSLLAFLLLLPSIYRSLSPHSRSVGILVMTSNIPWNLLRRDELFLELNSKLSWIVRACWRLQQGVDELIVRSLEYCILNLSTEWLIRVLNKKTSL